MHLIPIWLGPLASAAAQRPWWELGNENLPLPARGIAHYITIGPGGGGQSSELGDMGDAARGRSMPHFSTSSATRSASATRGPLPASARRTDR